METRVRKVSFYFTRYVNYFANYSCLKSRHRFGSSTLGLGPKFALMRRSVLALAPASKG